MEEEEFRFKMSVEGKVTDAGTFEVLAITAGEGNGWIFGADMLRESLPLWSEAQCFIDHSWGERSIRDLAGVFYDAEWDEVAQGVKVKLRATGPGGPLLCELGKEVITEKGPKPKIGFSADILFTAKDKLVERILRVYSVDLVYNPARGGAFLRALNQLQEKATTEAQRARRKPNLNQNQHGAAPSPKPIQVIQKRTKNRWKKKPKKKLRYTAELAETQLNEDREAVRLLLNEQKRQADLAQEAGEARKVRAEMCGYLLESALGASKLPAAMQKHVKEQFAGKVFQPAELQTAIEGARGLVSELTGGLVVKGPGRISGMFDTGTSCRQLPMICWVHRETRIPKA